jgi:hypothetical protein
MMEEKQKLFILRTTTIKKRKGGIKNRSINNKIKLINNSIMDKKLTAIKITTIITNMKVKRSFSYFNRIKEILT